MTAKELIKLLRKVPKDAKVFIVSNTMEDGSRSWAEHHNGMSGMSW